jgi:shikimate dehydrogenase
VFELPEPINARTRFCAVFGHPIKHSASPAMQNAGIGALRLNWHYLACEVRPHDLRQAILGAEAMHFIGLNLTVPHKLLAVDMVDALDESAQRWGSVNTIRFEGKEGQGSWRPLREFSDPPAELRSHGFNTDADAIVQAVGEELGLPLAGAKVLLLGAGGAGRTAALKFASAGVSELFLINRTVAKAEAVAAEIRKLWPSVKLSLEYPTSAVDLLLNATSLGLKPDDPLPFNAARFSLQQAKGVYDMIYRPPETPLLNRAKDAGCRVANGLSMLLYQGAKALEIWTGQPAPVTAMRHALWENVKNA